MRTSNPLSANFAASVPLPTGLNILRGWCSIDVQMRGRWFRIINTHLEEQLPPFLPDIQAYQAAELLAAPANVDAPVIVLGDFNSDGNGNYGPTVYPMLTGAGGFIDVWSTALPHDPGLTWGHDEFLSNKNLPLSLRLDLILFRGAKFDVNAAAVVDPLISSAPPYWFSDHAGVFASLGIR
jgi:endonuclease/exonuclease/phosphatase family metal-dependent hydrolase